MQLPKIIVWGASGHGKVVADAVSAQNRFELVGFVDDVHPAGAIVAGKVVLGNRDALVELRAQGIEHVIVGVGDCSARLELARDARLAGFALGTVVHPWSVVAPGVTLGPGSFVAAGAIVNVDARIGEGVIINTGATVDHDCSLADGVHIGPGVHLGGRVSVGRATWIGIGASVIDKVSIGDNTVVGAGATVVRDLPSNVVAFGVPARVQRKRLEQAS